MNAVRISPSPMDTWNRTMSHYSRILVFGPTGWFGRTALELSFPRVPLVTCWALAEVMCKLEKKLSLCMIGGFVRKPDQYALSSFVRQGLDSGNIRVRADRMVYRRYCAVEELLAVGLHLARRHSHSLLDSGGEKLEIFDLAQKVCEQIPGAKVILEHPARDSQYPDDYSSDNESWVQGIRETHLIPMSIEEQITNVIHALHQS